MRTPIQPGNKVGGPLAVIVLAVALLSTGAQETAAAQPKKVIYETDMCLDVDDVGGLAMLHALADKGEVEILAVCFNEVHPSGAAAIDAINTWYGRGGIPVGIYKGNLAAPDTSKYLGPVAAFPHDLTGETAPTALEINRKVLAEQPDKSVTIISVGFLNNIYDLLKAEPDLVGKKVKEMVVMAGRIKDDFNLSRHDLVAQSEYVIRHWPTPLVISSHGGGTKTGSRLSGTAAGNPVREAYYQWFDQSYEGRSSWDQVAVLYGVRGLGSCFREITTGKGTLRNGFEWQMQPGHRSYLQVKLSDQEFIDIIESLMIQPPRKQLAGGMDTHQPVQAQGPGEEPPAGAPYSPYVANGRPKVIVTTDGEIDDHSSMNVKTGHGPLGALYPQTYISEGDSPAIFYTIDNGLRNHEHPGFGGWGGRFKKVEGFARVYIDAEDEGGMKYQLARWIDAVNRDFQARMDWCVKDFKEANHPPVVKLAHAHDLKVRPGESVSLSAKGTTDPDGDEVVFHWWQYGEAGSYDGSIEIRDAGKQHASFTVPRNVDTGETIHVICRKGD